MFYKIAFKTFATTMSTHKVDVSLWLTVSFLRQSSNKFEFCTDIFVTIFVDVKTIVTL